MGAERVFGQPLAAFLGEGALPSVLLAAAEAGRDIGRRIAAGPLSGDHGAPSSAPIPAATRKRRSTSSPTNCSSAPSAPPRCARLPRKSGTRPRLLDPQGEFLVALDPLDGSSNIGVNVTMGSILAILAAPCAPASSPRTCCSRARAARRRADRLRPAPRFRVHARPGHACGDARPRDRRFPHDPLRHRDPRGHGGICDQRLQRAPLAGAGARLYRGLRDGRDRPAREEFQHALDRLAGRGSLSHSGARRRLSLSRRRCARAIGTAACDSSTRPTRSPSSSSRPAAWRRTASTASSTSRPTCCTSARRSIFGSTDKVERVRRYYIDGYRFAARAPLFGRRGLLR